MTFVIQQNVPLKDKNWFKTGGNARYFCQPKNGIEFKEALQFAQTHSLELFVLGEGANVLISDEGFDGLIIHPQSSDPIFQVSSETHGLVTCSAGLSMDAVITKTLEAGLIGLEVFSGIPGTIGGSAYINLHYFTHFLSDFLVSAQVIDKRTHEIFDVDAAWFNYGYNQSTLLNGNYYLINATLKLAKGSATDVAYAQGRRFEIIRHRMSRYPSSNTCGSFFRNFHQNEVTLVRNNKKMIYVAFYLDQIGVKGIEKAGHAIVSWQHANMLVTQEGATSQDIVTLARTLQQKVRDAFGITPQPECIFVGFKEYPLLS